MVAMDIIIAGAGLVGESLAEQISGEGHRVAVIDRDRTRIAYLRDNLDVLAVHGEATSAQALERAGVRHADMLIAVTNVDEVNLVVAMMASRLGVSRRIVRLRNREYLELDSLVPLRDLGVNQVINPEPLMVDALLHMMQIPGASSFAKLADGQVVMIGLDIPSDSPLAGKSLEALRRTDVPDGFLVLSIARGERIWVPRGSDTIRPDDMVFVLVPEKQIALVSSVVQRSPKDVDRIVVSGASRLGRTLAAQAAGFVPKVFLLEPDERLAEEAANELDGVTVLCGRPTDLALLEEAGIEECDLFAAVSTDDQSNILSALLAKKHSSTRAAVLVNQPDYVSVVDSLGVEIVLNPRLVAVSEILMHVRGGHVHAVTRLLEGGGAEILEMEVADGCEAVNKPLRELDMPADSIVGAVLRGNETEIPTGNTKLHPGDQVLVFGLPAALPKVERLFAKKRMFRS